MTLARVAIPVAVGETFTYEIPQGLEVTPGTRVAVPFGPRLLTAFVLETDVPHPGETVRLRKIAERLDPPGVPALVPDVLALCRWAADYYIAPIGEMLRIALPSSLSERGTLYARLAGAAAPVDAVAANGEADLLEALRTREYVRLVRRPQIAAARKLERKGLVQIEERLDDLGGVAQDQWLVLESPPSVLPSKQQDVIDLLTAAGNAAPRTSLLAAGASGSSIATLVRKGVLRTERRPRTHSLDAFIAGITATREIAHSAEQKGAIDLISRSIGSFMPFLLQGVTGSGKTEVYIEAMAEAVRLGRQAILLVPEISLTPVAAARLKESFGSRIAVLHSNLSPGERYDQWLRARRGEVDVAIGPRSALFVPFERLGLVIVDEEHDGAYKQDESPRYNARDLAVVRARLSEAPVVLGSATPSLESRENAERGRYERIVLASRVESRPLPAVEIVDIRRERGEKEDRGMIIFSGPLVEKLNTTFAAGEQAMILMNRRGYAPYLLCRECDHEFSCRDCSVRLTVHLREQRLVCHYCGFSYALPPTCPACKGEVLHPIGFGTEKVEERFRRIFPSVSVEVLDRDSTRRKGELVKILDRFRSGKTQALIGTQMISKGHDFPNVTLTAVLNADSILGYPDFRSAEKTFSLLTQVAGRAGRGERAGRVVIQSAFPDHYALQHAARQDYEAFYEAEIEFRKRFRYPPLTSMIAVLLRDTDRAAVEEDAQTTGRALEASLRSLPDVRIQGPTPAPLERLKGVWRFQLLVRSSERAALRRGVREAIERTRAANRIVDVDPFNLM